MSFIPGVVGAAGSVLGGYLGSSGTNRRSRTQKKNKRITDDILAGVAGEGPYADMFAMDQDAFQRSYVDPAKSMFENQIAPQIQQGYIASGLQRGTGLDDTLTRAGVDLDAMINSAYMDYMQNMMDRRMKGVGMAMNADVGGQRLSSSDRWNQALGGYLTSQGGQDFMGDMGKYGMHAAQHHSFRPGFSGGY
jgi:hypothetical protein